jgi:hypothetical protein
MRVRLGPVHLSRDLSRGRSRLLTAGERQALLNEIDAVSEPDESSDLDESIDPAALSSPEL